MEDVKAFYARLEASSIPKRYTHQIGESQVNIFLVRSVNLFSLVSYYHNLVWNLDAFCSSSIIIGLLHSVGAKALKNGESQCTLQLLRTGVFDLRHTGMNGKMIIWFWKLMRISLSLPQKYETINVQAKSLQKVRRISAITKCFSAICLVLRLQCFNKTD